MSSSDCQHKPSATQFLSLATMMAVSLLQPSSLVEAATCKTHMYQRNTHSSKTFMLMAFNHQDSSCDEPYRSNFACNTGEGWSHLFEDEWIEVKADRQGYTTIQNLIGEATEDPDADDNDDRAKVKYYTYDGIENQSYCQNNRAYKAKCDTYFVFYADTKKVCKAVVDENGEPLEDDDGKPYGNCESCSWQDAPNGRRTLRGTAAE